eukprot:s5817_g1.t1
MNPGPKSLSATLAPAICIPIMTDAASKQENFFFDKYWPSLSGGNPESGPPSSAMSTGPTEGEVDEESRLRGKKQPKNETGKGGTGTGRYGGWGGQGRGRQGGGPQRRGQDGNWRESEWDSWNSKSATEQNLAEEVKQLRACVFALQHMVLRTEDFADCLRSELSWVMFLRLDMKATVVPALFQQQQKWREIKANAPDSLKGPMRVSLVQQLFKELGARLATFHEQADFLQTVQKLGWYDHDKRTWAYVKWDADNERLAPDTAKEPLTFERLSAVVASLQQLAEVPHTVMRFHPSRPMEETMGGRNLTFTLQLCILGDSSKQFREHLGLLTGSAVTQLVGMGLRPERASRSALANLIQKQIQELADGEL